MVYVPTAVIWECALLARASRVRLRPNVRDFFQDLFSNPAYQPIDLSPEHVFLAEEHRFNRDPFDGLIVACAQVLDLPLISRDTAIQDSGAVKIVW
jgi:PIN domain nuclease of toxin-antitoxin system